MSEIVVRAAATLPSLEKAHRMLDAAESELKTRRTFEAAVKARATAKVALELAALRDLANGTKKDGRLLSVRARGLLTRAEKVHAEYDAEVRASRPKGRPRKTATDRVAVSRSQTVAEAKRAPLAELPDEDADRYLAACTTNLHEPSKSEAVSLAKKPPEVRAAVLTKLENGEAKSVKQAEEKLQQDRLAQIPKDIARSRESSRVLHGDLLTAGAEIADASVDVIITDPPYPEEFLPLYSSLSTLAARVLKPGGSCVVMVGQSYLPEILSRLSESLRYQWALSYLTPGGQAVQLWDRKVNAFWKPLLWFVNGQYTGDWIGDVCKSKTNDNDKRFHGWGQSESGMLDIVERFSSEGQVVLDPFCGAGTTGVAAVARGRRFLGIDIDEQHVRTTCMRLEALSAA